MASSEKVVLKLTHGGETHRMKVSLRGELSEEKKPVDMLTYERLLELVPEVFPRLTGAWVLVYRDDEGDVVTLTHALEFEEACRVLLELNAAQGEKGKPRGLHFFVMSRVSLREKVVTPVLQKMLELARLAGEATAQIRNSELVGRSRESIVRLAGGAITQIRNSELLSRGRESLGSGAVHTRTMLLSARSGVSTRLRHASSAVAAGIERRRRSSSASSPSSHSSDEAAFSPNEFAKTPSPCAAAVPATAVVSPLSSMEVTEAFKLADALGTVETVDMRQTEETVAAVAEPEVVAPSAQADEEEKEEDTQSAVVPVASLEVETRSREDEQVETESGAQEEAAYESDADTLCTTSCDEEDDREWDIVDGSHTDAIAETDGQWARELDVLRAILVNLDEELCCDLLAQHNGNVEAVLVELTNL